LYNPEALQNKDSMQGAMLEMMKRIQTGVGLKKVDLNSRVRIFHYQ